MDLPPLIFFDFYNLPFTVFFLFSTLFIHILTALPFTVIIFNRFHGFLSALVVRRRVSLRSSYFKKYILKHIESRIQKIIEYSNGIKVSRE